MLVGLEEGETAGLAVGFGAKGCRFAEVSDSADAIEEGHAY